MCGIIGILKPAVQSGEISSRIGSALDCMKHRGPDDVGEWISDDEQCGLGHVRLSIIDPSDSASQPMTDETGRHSLVFNGEIYNYSDLYERYCPKDGSVNQKSDTAVLLFLLQAYGKNALEFLDGMFAFAFLDAVERTVFLARDRFGEKPLYWLAEGDVFSFSSELSGLKALHHDRPWSLDASAVSVFHMLGSIPSPRTIYRNVNALEAGCWVEWHRDRRISSGCYWNLVKSTEVKIGGARDEEIQFSRGLFTNAISSRMVSDVPIGVFLSGGLDSSAILATTCALGQPADAALCVDFPEAEYSEYDVAKAVARRFNVPLHRHLFDRRMFESGIQGYFATMDEPTTDGFNTYFLSRAAKDMGIKVWLSGVGGDELFGGYPSFDRIRTLMLLSRVAQAILPATITRKVASMSNNLRLNRALNLAEKGESAIRAYQACRLLVPPGNASKLLSFSEKTDVESLQDLLDSIYPEIPPSADYFQIASLLESHVYLRSQLLRDIDNFAMAESIEVRAPFLDHNLVSGVWALPSGSKNYNRNLKPLLIDSLPIQLPPEVPRNSKRGFTFPVERWARDGMASDFWDTVQDSSNFDYWSSGGIRNLWRSYQEGTVHWSVIWMLYSFAKWREAHPC